MIRWHGKLIVWIMIASMLYSPALVFAAQQTPAENQAKVDFGYVTPAAAGAAAVFPRRVLTAPEMEMLPLEVITAWGEKVLGFDPLEIEWALVFFEMPEGGATMAEPPLVAVVLHAAKPFPKGKLFRPLWDRTNEAQLDGKTYRQAVGPMDASIYRPDENTVILSTDALLPRVLKNHAQPRDGRVSRVLGRIKGMPDATALVYVEPLRPVLAIPLSMAPLPPQLADVKRIPDLLASVGVKINARGNQSLTLILRANDEKAAVELEKIIDQVFDAARQQMAASMARQANSDDPIEQAAVKYSKRVGEKMFEFLRPCVKGIN